ncbi:MAG: 3D domain-containing protein [Gudongella sp.]|nr:3D domain-containing protein [Gudongella sp.]
MKRVKIHPFRLLSVLLLSLLILGMIIKIVALADKGETKKIEYILISQSEYEETYKEESKEENEEIENKLQSSREDEVEEVARVRTSLGEYTITKYCSCEKCCGEYAKNRPIKENGEELVTGAYGTELTADYSVASPLAPGTRLEIEGLGTYKVQDTTSTWVADKYNGKVIDIYVSDHSLAINYKEVLDVWEVK